MSEQQLLALNERLTASKLHLEAMVAGCTDPIGRRRQVAESLRDRVSLLNSRHPLAEVLDYSVATATSLVGAESGAILILQLDRATLATQQC